MNPLLPLSGNNMDWWVLILAICGLPIVIVLGLACAMALCFILYLVMNGVWNFFAYGMNIVEYFRTDWGFFNETQIYSYEDYNTPSTTVEIPPKGAPLPPPSAPPFQELLNAKAKS
jgi:hypothetical protein